MVELPETLRRAMELRGLDPDAVAEKATEISESGVLDEPERPPAVPVEPPADVQESLLGVMEPPRAEPKGGMPDDDGMYEPTEARDVLSYEQFFTAAEVETFKRVKRGSMRLARVARAVVAEMVGGTLGQEDDSHKEYLTTRCGKFRLAMGHNSDNETEMREHGRLGAEVVSMGDPDEMARFFSRHGIAAPALAVDQMYASISARL